MFFMSTAKIKKRVLITGPAPENVGGISMHIRRLVNVMADRCEFDFVDEARNRTNGYFNLRSCNIFRYIKKVICADVVHINSGAFLLRAFNIFMCALVFRKYTVVTIHRDPSIEPHNGIMRWLLSNCNVVINVNETGHNIFKTEGKCDYRLLPAYLPPNLDVEPKLPHDVSVWLEHVRKDTKAVVMCNNASNLLMHDGVDLYGTDLCVAAVNELPKNYYLVFVVVKCEIPEFYDAYHVAIAKYGLEDRILLTDKSMSFVRLISESDIVLRTTNTDGDSITVREALALGKPVVASDVVARPEGTTLFANRNVASLIKAIVEVCGQKVTPVTDNTDYAAIYSEFYRL